ncbi:MAG: methionyl-tRNA formyltransferase [Candidatus Eisenbacteria bacterium RBG_16_71_46]|nr:MAG: methionyl-tRNA formyltransferase [Candidatus Eisenbacteria bacterium RBG_16_71_46]
MGTPEFAVPALHAVARSCALAAVVTQPDRPRGRGRQTSPSAVAVAAQPLGVTVLKPQDVNADDVAGELGALAADLFAVVAFGAILSPRLLGLPRIGSLNLHGSLLPDYRGASPVQRALWDGRAATGVTTLWMDEGIDTGDLVLQRWAPIESQDTAGTLAGRLADLGGPLLAESLLLAHAGRAPRRPQVRGAGSYARKLSKQDGDVNWALDALTVWNHQRAVTPWPGAATARAGRRLLVTRAWPHHLLPVEQPPGTVLAVTGEGIAVACSPGVLLMARVKPEARDEMDAAGWARGARLERGERLEMEREAHL